MPKFRVRYSSGGTALPPTWLKDRDTGRDLFDSMDEARRAIRSHSFRISDGPKPLLWQPPSLCILEILFPPIVERYRITADGPVLNDI